MGRKILLGVLVGKISVYSKVLKKGLREFRMPGKATKKTKVRKNVTKSSIKDDTIENHKHAMAVLSLLYHFTIVKLDETKQKLFYCNHYIVL